MPVSSIRCRTPFSRRKVGDRLEQRRADALAAHLGQREHALDLGLAVVRDLERAHAHGAAGLVARDEHRGVRAGHLLDRHLELELDRRQRQEVRVELGDQLAHIVLQRRLLPMVTGHSTTLGTTKKLSSVSGALATIFSG